MGTINFRSTVPKYLLIINFRLLVPKYLLIINQKIMVTSLDQLVINQVNGKLAC